MKTNILLAAFLVIALASKAQHEPKSAFKLNPLSLLVKTGNIAYEKATGTSQSFQIGGFYSGLGIDDLQYQGFGITPEYRFYFGGEKSVFNGGYVAPFARYQNFSLSDKATESKADFSTLGGGVVLGWEKSWKSGFLLEFFAGPSFNAAKFKAGNEDDFAIRSGIKGFGLRSGITVGFTF